MQCFFFMPYSAGHSRCFAGEAVIRPTYGERYEVHKDYGLEAIILSRHFAILTVAVGSKVQLTGPRFC